MQKQLSIRRQTAFKIFNTLFSHRALDIEVEKHQLNICFNSLHSKPFSCLNLFNAFEIGKKRWCSNHWLVYKIILLSTTECVINQFDSMAAKQTNENYVHLEFRASLHSNARFNHAAENLNSEINKQANFVYISHYFKSSTILLKLGCLFLEITKFLYSIWKLEKSSIRNESIINSLNNTKSLFYWCNFLIKWNK